MFYNVDASSYLSNPSQLIDTVIGGISSGHGIFGGSGQPDYGTRKDVDYNDYRNTLLSNVKYWLDNPDVQQTWQDTPFAHWYVFGKNENRPQWIYVDSPKFTKENSYAAVIHASQHPELWQDIKKNRDRILNEIMFIDTNQTPPSGSQTPPSGSQTPPSGQTPRNNPPTKSGNKDVAAPPAPPKNKIPIVPIAIGVGLVAVIGVIILIKKSK